MQLKSPHRLSPSVVLASLALEVASSGTALAAGGVGSGDRPIARPDAISAVGADVAHFASAIGKPRRPDGSLLPRLGRWTPKPPPDRKLGSPHAARRTDETATQAHERHDERGEVK